MNKLAELPLVVMTRWQVLTSPQEGERGDNPVSTAVITALIAAAAVTVVGAIVVAAKVWTDKIPK